MEEDVSGKYFLYSNGAEVGGSHAVSDLLLLSVEL